MEQCPVCKSVNQFVQIGSMFSCPVCFLSYRNMLVVELVAINSPIISHELKEVLIGSRSYVEIYDHENQGNLELALSFSLISELLEEKGIQGGGSCLEELKKSGLDGIILTEGEFRVLERVRCYDNQFASRMIC